MPENIIIRPNLSEWRNLTTDKVIPLLGDLVKISLDSPVKKKFSKQTLPTKIIASGHQPVIYHPGLLKKQLVLNQFLQENEDYLGINFIIDTDKGDAGEFYLPVKDSGAQRFSFSDGHGLMGAQKIIESSQIVTSIKKITAQHPEIDQISVDYALGLFSSSVNKFCFEVNSSIRERFEGDRNYLEITLSQVCMLPQVRDFFAILLRSPLQLFVNYNTALNNYRENKKIDNTANPFPNLQSNADNFELPFWVVDKALLNRHVLLVNKDGKLIFNENNKINEDDYFLAPRGAMITILLRGLLSNLFIHGLGGETYDEFTDYFAAEYVKIPLAGRVAVSQTKLLFETAYNKLLESEKWSKHKKELSSKTEKYLDQLPVELKDQLESLAKMRTELVASLPSVAQDKKRAVLLQLNQLNTEIKQITDPWCEQQSQFALSTSHSTKQMWEYRKYPIFLFASEQLR